MAPHSFLLDDALDQYVRSHTTTVDAAVEQLIVRTGELGPISRMQLGVDQAALLTALTSFANVTHAIEIGTFTGLSSLSIARGLAPGGTLVCCDVSDEWTSIAREAWAEAGVADRIDLRLAPATETLAALEPGTTFDLAFVDADKGGYVDYYEELVPRMRAGGLIIADNTLWGGRIVDESVDDESTKALRRYNDRAADDPRVRTTILSVGDGMTLSQKL